MSRHFVAAPHGRFDEESLTGVIEGSDIVLAAAGGHKVVHIRMALADFKALVAGLDDSPADTSRPSSYTFPGLAATPRPPDETQSAPPAAPTAAPTAARVSSGIDMHIQPGRPHASPADLAFMTRRSVVLGSN